MTDQLPERIWVPTMPTATGQKIIGGHSDEEVAGWVHFLRADTAVTKAEADAMVAAALRRAARACDDTAYSGEYPMDDMVELGCLRCRDNVKRLTPADARAALGRIVREAVEAERERCARIVEEYAPNSSFMEDALHHIRKEPPK